MCLHMLMGRPVALQVLDGSQECSSMAKRGVLCRLAGEAKLRWAGLPC